MLPTIWRFAPLFDRQVSVVSFRDLDSVVSAREVAAVGAWLAGRRDG